MLGGPETTRMQQPQAGEPPIPGVRSSLLGAALLLCLAAMVYGQVWGHRLQHYDDTGYILGNAAVRSGFQPGGMEHAFSLDQTYGYWHPLTVLSLMLDVETFGIHAGAMLLENALWHAVAAVLLFLALVRATGRAGPSLLAAALFMVHPLQVEAVAWVVERKTVLSGALAMLALYLYIRYAERPGWRRMLPTALALALGIMAKPAIVALPVAFLALDLWPLERMTPAGEGRTWGAWVRGLAGTLPRLLREKLPLFALAVSGTLVAMLSRSDVSVAQGGLSHIPLGLRLANIPLALLGYLRKFVMPWDLSIHYPFPQHIPAWQWAVALLAVAALTAGLAAAARRHPWCLAGWLFFLAMLAPVSGVVQTGLWPALADRFSYLPNLGLCVMAAWGLFLLAERRGQARGRAGVAILSAAVVGYFAFLAWAQVGLWRSGITLFAHAVQMQPEDRVSRYNYALALANEGHLSEAVIAMRQAASLGPSHPKAYDWGDILLRLGRTDEAVQLARRGLAHFPDNPAYRLALAKAHEARGELDQALAQYDALDFSKDPTGEFSLAYAGALDSAGRHGKAAEVYENLLRTGMRTGIVYAKAGWAQLESGNGKRAAELFATALDLEPELASTLHGLARLARQQGDAQRAESLEVRAEALERRDAEAFMHLGETLLREGRAEDAGACYREALRILPGYGAARARLHELGLPLPRDASMQKSP